jgi:hypothetical protein
MFPEDNLQTSLRVPDWQTPGKGIVLPIRDLPATSAEAAAATTVDPNPAEPEPMKGEEEDRIISDRIIFSRDREIAP